MDLKGGEEMQNINFTIDSLFSLQQNNYTSGSLQNGIAHQEGEFVQVLSSKLNNDGENDYNAKTDNKKDGQDNMTKDPDAIQDVLEDDKDKDASGQQSEEHKNEDQAYLHGLSEQMKLSEKLSFAKIANSVVKDKKVPYVIFSSQHTSFKTEQSKLDPQKGGKKHLNLNFKPGLEMTSKNFDKVSRSKAVGISTDNIQNLREVKVGSFQLDEPINMKTIQQTSETKVNKIDKASIAVSENHGRKLIEYNLDMSRSDLNLKKDFGEKTYDKTFVRTVQEISSGNTGDVARNIQITSVLRPEASTMHNSAWQVVQQIVQKTQTLVHQNKTYMEIQLKPEFLGKVKVHLTYSDGLVTASLTADKSHVGSLLNSAMQQIRNAMQEQGIKVEYLGVNIGGHEGYAFNEGNQHQENNKNHNNLNIKALGGHVLNINQGDAANVERQITGVNYLA